MKEMEGGPGEQTSSNHGKKHPGYFKKRKGRSSHSPMHGGREMKLLYESMSQGVVFQSADFKIGIMNPAAERILGKTSRELMGKTSEYTEHHTFHEDGTIFKSSEHPTMVALRTGLPCKNVLMNVYNPQEHAYHWINISATPLFHPGKNKPYMVYAIFDDVTEKIETEKALKLSQVEHDKIIGRLPAFILVSNKDGRLDFVNQAFLEYVGKTEEQVRRTGWVTTAVHPENLTMVRQQLARHTKKKKAFSIEVRVKKHSGEFFWFMAHGKPFLDEQGGLARWYFTLTDIHQQKEAELALAASEERFRLMFMTIHEAMFLTLPNGTITSANPAAERMFGRSEAEICRLGRNGIMDMSDPRFKQAIQQRESSGSFIGELTGLRKDGTPFPVEVYSTTYHDSQGNTRTGTFMRDISERKKIEQEIREANERFNQIVTHLNDFFWISDAATREYIYASPSFESIFGQSLESVLQLPGKYLDIVLPEDRHILQKAIAIQRGQKIPTDIQYRIRHADGRILWVREKCSPVLDEAGRVVRVVGTTRDNTSLVESQKKLEQMNQQLEERVQQRTAEVQAERDFAHLVMENMPQGLMVLGEDNKVEYANPALAATLGIGQAELAGRNLEGTGLPAELADWLGHAPASRGQMETTMKCPNGATCTLLVNSTPRHNNHGITGSIVTFTDISQEKEIEKNLRESRDQLTQANLALEQASKLKDDFISSMSHELRTPLVGILGLSDVLQMPTLGALSEKQASLVKNIHESGLRLLEMVNNILDYSLIEAGKLDLRTEPCPVYDIGQACFKQFSPLAHEKKQQFSFHGTDHALMAKADSRRLKQMISILLSNAIKFTTEGGSVGITLEKNTAANTVEISVWDTGAGIKPEDMPRLFQAFVQLDGSMERRQTGAGLGLALCQRLAMLHGGRVGVQSTPGQGSRFTISLPLA